MLPTFRVLLAITGLGVVVVALAVVTSGLISPPEFPTRIGEVPSLSRSFIQEAMAPRLAIEARGDPAEERIPAVEATGMAAGADAQWPLNADDGSESAKAASSFDAPGVPASTAREPTLTPAKPSVAEQAQPENGKPAGKPPTLALDEEGNGRGAASTKPRGEGLASPAATDNQRAAAVVARLPPERRASSLTGMPAGESAVEHRGSCVEPQNPAASQSGAASQNPAASQVRVARPAASRPAASRKSRWRRARSSRGRVRSRRRRVYAVAPRPNRTAAATTRAAVTATDPNRFGTSANRLCISGTEQ